MKSEQTTNPDGDLNCCNIEKKAKKIPKILPKQRKAKQQEFYSFECVEGRLSMSK